MSSIGETLHPEHPISDRKLSLHSSRNLQGYAVFEAEHRFWRERLAEYVVRGFAVAMILFGCGHWFLAGGLVPLVAIEIRLGMTALFILTGLGLYIFAMRGFRRMLRVDAAGKALHLCRLNSSNQSLVKEVLPLDRIESAFVVRSQGNVGSDTLQLRVRGFPKTRVALRGDRAELENLHDKLCRDIHTILDCGPKRVKRKTSNYPFAHHARPTRALSAKVAGPVNDLLDPRYGPASAKDQAQHASV